MYTKSVKALKALSFLFLAIMISTCKFDSEGASTVDETNNNRYYNEAFQIDLEIPSQWEVLAMSKTKEIKKQGNDASEDFFGRNTADTWTTLLHIGKGKSNNQMTINKSIYRPEIHGPNYENSKKTRILGIKRMLENNPGVEVKSISDTTEIDGIKFYTNNMTVKRKGKTIVFQTLYEKKYDSDEIILISLTAEDSEELQRLKSIIKGMKIGRKD